MAGTLAAFPACTIEKVVGLKRITKIATCLCQDKTLASNALATNGAAVGPGRTANRAVEVRRKTNVEQGAC
jgi:hypothetical protein